MSTLRLSGLASGMDTEAMIKELMKAQSQKKVDAEKSITRLQWKKDAWEDINKKIYDFYTKSLQKMKRSSTFLKKTASVSHENLISASATSGATKGIHKFKVTSLAEAGQAINTLPTTPAKLARDTKLSDVIGGTGFTSSNSKEDADGKRYMTIRISSKGTDASGDFKEIKLYADDTIEGMINKVNDSKSGVKVSLDSNFNNMTFTSENTGSSSRVFITLDELPQSTLFTNLGFESPTSPSDPKAVIEVGGEDAKFTYGGKLFTSDKNNFTFNGLELNLKGVTPSTEEVTIVVDSDTDAVYEEIKSFINDYNKLITDMNIKTNADKAKGYEPLTADEKKAMTDDDIKLWEKKIKDSLLRRDNKLEETVTFMRDRLSRVDSYGSDYRSLSALGIVTGDYSEKGVLHIEGDEDDTKFSLKDNALKKAIENNPDEVEKFFTGLATEIYNGLSKKMESNKLSSAFTLYNDKQIDEEIKDKKEWIKEFDKKLTALENRYYKQFTAMETMLQKMNQQSTSLTSMLGG